MDELGMDKTNYEWYLNLRKFGGVEHAGYGLGFERMIMYPVSYTHLSFSSSILLCQREMPHCIPIPRRLYPKADKIGRAHV